MRPERTPDTMSMAIEMTSPSGSISKRALKAAQKRLSLALWGEEGLQAPTCPQPTEYERLMREATNLRDLASRGMHPRSFVKQANELEARALKTKSGELENPPPYASIRAKR